MKLKALALPILACMAIALPLSARADDAAAATPDVAPPVKTKTLFEQVQAGGWVMVPILLCSMATFYLIGDGIVRTSRKRVSSPLHEEAIKDLFRQGNYVEAYAYCKNNPTCLTNVLRSGLSLLGEGKIVVEEAMMSELGKENSKMLTLISYLSVIGVCTPMIGLLGTVTGMIRAFATLGSSGIGDPSSLSAAIGEVLIATASGLVIAIPAFFAFYLLRNRATKALHEVQDTINSLFRKMPYDALAGATIGEEEIYAAKPIWPSH